MDLGLDTLSDDQLVELLAQASEEIVRRDIQVVAIAQQKVWDAAEKGKVARAELVRVLKARMELERSKISEAAIIDIERLYAAGELQLLTPQEEADLAAAGDLEGRIELLDGILDGLQTGNSIEFCLQLTPNEAYVSSGRTLVRARLPRPQELRTVAGMIRSLLTP